MEIPKNPYGKAENWHFRCLYGLYEDRDGELWLCEGVWAQNLSWEEGAGVPMYLFQVQQRWGPLRPPSDN
jgi:hypothetical protein